MTARPRQVPGGAFGRPDSCHGRTARRHVRGVIAVGSEVSCRFAAPSAGDSNGCLVEDCHAKPLEHLPYISGVLQSFHQCWGRLAIRQHAQGLPPHLLITPEAGRRGTTVADLLYFFCGGPKNLRNQLLRSPSFDKQWSF